MAREPSDHEQIWERGWDGHERAQRERLARLTLEQKLDWLEEAQRFARDIQRDEPADRSTPPGGQKE